MTGTAVGKAQGACRDRGRGALVAADEPLRRLVADLHLGAQHVALESRDDQRYQFAGQYGEQVIRGQRRQVQQGDRPALRRVVTGQLQPPALQARHVIGQLALQKTAGVRAAGPQDSQSKFCYDTPTFLHDDVFPELSQAGSAALAWPVEPNSGRLQHLHAGYPPRNSRRGCARLAGTRSGCRRRGCQAAVAASARDWWAVGSGTHALW